MKIISFIKNRLGGRNLAATLVLFAASMHAIFLFQDFVTYRASLARSAAALLLIYVLIGAKNSLRVTIALFTVALPLFIYANFIFPRRAMDTLGYLDFARGHYVFEKNLSLRYDLPGGDLSACPGVKVDAERKIIDFHTDSYGFRNSADWRLAKIALVGDSFLVGATPRDGTIGELLKRKHGVETYTLAYPGDIYDYALFIKAFEKRLGNRFKAAVFVFEGNDFEGFAPGGAGGAAGGAAGIRAREGEQRIIESLPMFLRGYVTFFIKPQVRIKTLFRAVKSARGAARRDPDCAGKITVFEAETGARMAFSNRYIEAAERPSCAVPAPLLDRLKTVRGRVGWIFFIPEKYRVYHGLLRGDDSSPLPNAQWECARRIAAELGAQCVDLTPALRAAAAESLKSNRFVYWKDDTHTNSAGNAVIAAEVFRAVSEQDKSLTTKARKHEKSRKKD